MNLLRIRDLVGTHVSAARLDLASGQCVALHGPSGGGKTLLLRAIADLDESGGDMRLRDTARSAISGPQWRRQVSYVAAESHWWCPDVRPHAQDWDNDALERLGFGPDVLEWEVQRLSSGERQRLALARTLARSPEVLLLDEPTANLDPANTERVERLIDAWRERSRGGVIWVSHDPEQRRRVANRELLVRAGRLEHAHDD